ncbi:DUF2218 domain-containing protein [Actinopolyspora erythraea]|uniref:DUF2218 domain-containing protein n=1 Tax=Actinopolyspora erythraea TaxID=414996 RepID=A0A099D2T3_9ACTN|nr:DUF2218 domain-containing protein [Actinopolyspora erythraea]ASU77418.1 DUF2218 domain-containing protein [Actinopolyspora erythraea]KGI80369.1 hypothetical protein IL38_18135 [Actinopolyspora erythraea]
MLTSQAEVATERPQRYLAQLCEHFAHKASGEHDQEKGHVEFDVGRCDMHAEDRILLLRARAEDRAGIDRVKQVVGTHLERFGARDELAVHWTDAEGS